MKKQRYEPKEKCESVPFEDCEKIHGQRPQQVRCAVVTLVCTTNFSNKLWQICNGGKAVLTEIDVKNYGIKVTEPLCKEKKDDPYGRYVKNHPGLVFLQPIAQPLYQW